VKSDHRQRLKSLDLDFPRVSEAHRHELIQVRALLEVEDDIREMPRQASQDTSRK
jgi:hypothetical protein